MCVHIWCDHLVNPTCAVGSFNRCYCSIVQLCETITIISWLLTYGYGLAIDSLKHLSFADLLLHNYYVCIKYWNMHNWIVNFCIANVCSKLTIVKFYKSSKKHLSWLSVYIQWPVHMVDRITKIKYHYSGIEASIVNCTGTLPGKVNYILGAHIHHMMLYKSRLDALLHNWHPLR